MKIQETITRECCELKDMLVRFATEKEDEHYFCVHCGQNWKKIKYTDEAGDSDTKLIKVEKEVGNEVS